MKFIFVSFILIALSACQAESPDLSAKSGQSSVANIIASQVHMYELPPGQTRSAIYMRLQNKGDESVELLHLASPIAGALEVHHTVHDEDGMMKMREVNQLAIKPGETLDFEPGGLHIMLFDVVEPPKAGESVQLTLEFNKQVLNLPVEVRSIQ